MFLTRAAGYFICISKKKKSFFSIQFVSPQKGEYQTCWELNQNYSSNQESTKKHSLRKAIFSA